MGGVWERRIQPEGTARAKAPKLLINREAEITKQLEEAGNVPTLHRMCFFCWLFGKSWKKVRLHGVCV